MMAPILLLSGTPGTGKTTIAKILEQHYQFYRISLGEEVISHQLISQMDEKRDTRIIDLEKIQTFYSSQYLSERTQKAEKIVIESHYADVIHHSSIKLGIILRCHPSILQKRLHKRHYSDKKINENIQAELLADCIHHMRQNPAFPEDQYLFEIDTSTLSEQDTANQICQIFNDPQKFGQFSIGKISWLSDPTVEIHKYL